MVVRTFTVPFCTWLLLGLFMALPKELEEAALVDGAIRTNALSRVLLPLAAPGIVVSAVFAFTLSWNAFLSSTAGWRMDWRPARSRAEPGRSD